MTRYGYRQVSLKEAAIDKLRVASAWMTGDNGRHTTLSETVETLVGWYEQARKDEAAATQPPSGPLLPHTKDQPHKNEDCDVCGFNMHKFGRTS